MQMQTPFLSHATPKEIIGEEGKVTEGDNGSNGMLLLNEKADVRSLKLKIPTTKIYLLKVSKSRNKIVEP